MSKTNFAYYQSPIGMIELSEVNKSIDYITFIDSEKTKPTSNNSPILKKAVKQLDEYFAGKRLNFELPLSPKGTAFQKSVWKVLQGIPHGKTVSYLDIAKQLGDVKAVRAVGMANGKNPIAIVIPCHRVIGANGKLTGYAGGLERKQWLLELESKKEQLKLF